MKKILVFYLLILLAGFSQAQPTFDLGLKGGVHFSNMSLDNRQEWLALNSESITQIHWGVFGRLGYNRLYLQPEIYFSKKGGDLTSDYYQMVMGFDYSNVDVPLLLGYKIIKGSAIDFRIMAGPVFSFVIDANYPDELDPYLKEEFFNQHLWGVQYGLGIDVLFLTLDARVEHGSKVYDDPELISGKSTTFMLSVGFKIL